jgi:hypothetical protein
VDFAVNAAPVSRTVTGTGVGLTVTVTIVATDTLATEARRTTGAFRVSRTGSTASPLTVFYSVAGTATSGSDYGSLTGSVIIPGGSKSATLIVAPIDDDLIEVAETVVVTLSPASAYAVGAANSATVTITDNDRPTVTVRASDSRATEVGPTTGTFTITRTAVTPSVPLTVFYTVSGTATPDDDYVSLSGSVTIPAGSNSATIMVEPLDDVVIETAETVVVTLDPAPAYVVGTRESATVTITDNDRPTVSVRALDSSATEVGPTTGTFAITRTAVSPSVPLTVFYTVTGTATPGSDYLALAASAIIPAGSNSATIIVTPIDDVLTEATETVVITLLPDATYVVGGGRSATIRIAGND